MKREEAIEVWRRLPIGLMDLSCEQKSDLTEALNIALAALRGPTREQVEKAFRAHWEDVDSGSGMLSKCSNCGFKALYSNIYVFCPDCGSPFTDAAVDIVMERLEKFYEDIQKLNGYKEWTNNGKMSLDKDIFSKGAKIYSPETCCFVPMSINISEANARNPQNIKKLHERRKVKYVLSKSDERLVFNSEKEACEAMDVHKCSIASCYRRGYKCKGYEISKLENEMED